MRLFIILSLTLNTIHLAITAGIFHYSLNSTTELDGFLSHTNQRLAELYNREVFAKWQTEINGPNDLYALLQSEIAAEEIMDYVQLIAPKATKWKRLPVDDDSLRRQLAHIPVLGYEALPTTDVKLMYIVTANMAEIYKKTKLCSFGDPQQCNLVLIPDVQDILHASKDVAEIEYYWLEWRRKTGVAAKEDFTTFVELYRKTAKLNGFTTASEFWFKDLEENSEQALKLMESLMARLQPLFLQFHAHVRAALRKRYGEKLVPRFKPYPQNLAEIFIGNAYRRADPEWYIKVPYVDATMPNITANLLAHELDNAQRIFWNVEEYFRSLGMPNLDHDFWSNSARAKAELDGDDVTCWHKAWKYYGQPHINFSYCPRVDEERFFNMFEAVSDAYYYRAYNTQPTLLAEEPFPHFSDALGKMFALSASSPAHLQKLNLIGDHESSAEYRINRLYWQGLRTIFLLPVFYVLDRYRVDVLDGKQNISDNCAYWQLTERYTGAEPPVERTNADFDAPAKLLVEVDDQYTSQIMSIVLQYQLYKHFCEISGQYRKDDTTRPLDMCDLSNQRKVGPLVLQAMSLGSSKSYNEALKIMTNETVINMDGLLEYFQPLYDWLVEENSKNNVDIGWVRTTKCVP